MTSQGGGQANGKTGIDRGKPLPHPTGYFGENDDQWGFKQINRASRMLRPTKDLPRAVDAQNPTNQEGGGGGISEAQRMWLEIRNCDHQQRELDRQWQWKLQRDEQAARAVEVKRKTKADRRSEFWRQQAIKNKVITPESSIGSDAGASSWRSSTKHSHRSGNIERRK